MNTTIFSNIYWGKTVKLLLLYLVFVLFVIAIALLINEIFLKKENYYIKKQCNKILRIITFKKIDKTYLDTKIELTEEEVEVSFSDVEVEDPLPPAFNEQYHIPKKHVKILSYKVKEKIYLTTEKKIDNFVCKKQNSENSEVKEKQNAQHKKVINYVRVNKNYLPSNSKK